MKRCCLCAMLPVLVVGLTGCSGQPGDEQGALSRITGPAPPGMAAAPNGLTPDVTIGFDVDALGRPISEDEEIFNQYEAIGVRFRDEMSLYTQARGESPGEVEDDEALSPPNSLEAGDDEPGVFVLFEDPVASVQSYVLSEEDDDDHGEDDEDIEGDDHGDADGGHNEDVDGEDDEEVQVVYLEVYDESLNSLGKVSVEVSSSEWRLISFTSDQPIAAARFFSMETEEDDRDDHGESDGEESEFEEFYMDDLGITLGPGPGPTVF